MKHFFTDISYLKFSLISGIGVGIAYLPFYLGFFAYFSFVPLFYVWSKNNYKKNFLGGYVFGLVYNLISNYWIGMNSGATVTVVIFSLFCAITYLSIFWGVGGLLIGLIEGRKVRYFAMPFLVVSLEWLRSFGPLGFSWGNLALTQSKFSIILQHMDYGGSYILALWICIINSLICYSLFEQPLTLKNKIRLGYIFLLFMGIGVLKKFYYSSKEYDYHLNIAVIQPNIDPNEKWDRANRDVTLEFMDSLYNVAINMNPDIILFPETALPTYLRLNNKVKNKIQSKVDSTSIPILIGTVDRRYDALGKKLYFNSSMFFKPYQSYDIYDKIHLVPFAEYDLMPELLHPLVALNLNIDRGIFAGGDNYKVFKINDVNFSNLICYESSFSKYSRNFVNNGAQFLMIQANDGWLGNSAGPYQHFEHAKLRSIENRIPIVRSGNTGISGAILPSGLVKEKVPIGKESVFSVNIPLGKNNSLYTRFGDVLAVMCFLIFIFIHPFSKCIK